MQQPDYIDLVKEMLSGCLFIPKEKLESDTILMNITGFDSMTFEALLLQIEQYLHQDIEPEAIIQVRTIADLADYLKARDVV